MMIKYRVHEVAKDLGLPNKEVIDTLQKYKMCIRDSSRIY